MAAPVIIDAHVHFRSPGPALDQAELARTLRRADAVGIERLVLVGSIIAHGPNPTRRQVRATNEQTIRAVQQQPERFWGLCYVNPLHGRWARQELLRCVRDGPLCGLKLWVACRASDPAVRDLMQLAHELGVAVLQHAWNKAVPELPGESTAADVARLAEQLPDLRIQMAHMGGVGWRGINQVTPYRNILIDTGGAQPIAGLLEYALRRIGPDRIVFASDYPVRDLAVKRAIVEAAPIDQHSRRAILHDNARRLWDPGQRDQR